MEIQYCRQDQEGMTRLHAGVPGSGKSTAAAAVSSRINDIWKQNSRSDQDWAVNVPMDGG